MRWKVLKVFCAFYRFWAVTAIRVLSVLIYGFLIIRGFVDFHDPCSALCTLCTLWVLIRARNPCAFILVCHLYDSFALLLICILIEYCAIYSGSVSSPHRCDWNQRSALERFPAGGHSHASLWRSMSCCNCQTACCWQCGSNILHPKAERVVVVHHALPDLHEWEPNDCFSLIRFITPLFSLLLRGKELRKAVICKFYLAHWPSGM